ncbi:hypothetical protein N9R98_00775 [bacterium]|nr:hypothetical protein [bacterium]
MTKFNQAVLAAVSSIALFGGALALITPPAKADYFNSTRIGNQTFGSGSNGSTFNTNQIGGQTFYNGNDSNGNHFSGSCNQIGNQTFCN